jgi:hypothetical protein
MEIFFCTACEAGLLFGDRRCDHCGGIVGTSRSPNGAEKPLPTRRARVRAFFESQAGLSLTTLVVFLGLGIAMVPMGRNPAHLQPLLLAGPMALADVDVTPVSRRTSGGRTNFDVNKESKPLLDGGESIIDPASAISQIGMPRMNLLTGVPKTARWCLASPRSAVSLACRGKPVPVCFRSPGVIEFEAAAGSASSSQTSLSGMSPNPT